MFPINFNATPELLRKICADFGGSIVLKDLSDEELKYFNLGDEMLIGGRYVVDKKEGNSVTIRLKERI